MAARLVIVGLGDSTTAGTPGFLSPVEAPPDGMGDRESQYSYWMMRAHPDWRVLNRGVNGERTDQILSRFQRDVAAHKPAVVIVLAGVNDIYQGRPTASVERNLESIYSLAKKGGVVAVAATILPYNISGPRESAAIRLVNAWIESGAKASGRLFCDTNAAVRSKSDPDRLASSPDAIHPDVAGYRRMGEALVSTLEAAGY